MRLAIAALLGAAALCAPFQASAASRACRQLEARLSGVSGNGKPALLRKYDSAIDRQTREIDKTQRQTRHAGCGFSLFSRNINQCAALNNTLDRMNSNLDDLQRKRSRLAGGAGRVERSRILAALKARGCREEPVAVTREVTRPAETPDDENKRQRDELAEYIRTDHGSTGGKVIIRRSGGNFLPSGGQYKTMCVRTCDGYFFPMSSASSVGDFQRDQSRCEAACPGTEIQMFYSDGVADDTANMTSAVTGSPYRDLANAYVYKRLDIPREPSCACGGEAQESSIIGDDASAMQRPQYSTKSTSSIIDMRPALPATDADASSRGAPPEADTEVPDKDRKVRVVGPTFLPAPREATGLQAPAPKTSR